MNSEFRQFLSEKLCLLKRFVSISNLFRFFKLQGGIPMSFLSHNYLEPFSLLHIFLFFQFLLAQVHIRLLNLKGLSVFSFHFTQKKFIFSLYLFRFNYLCDFQLFQLFFFAYFPLFYLLLFRQTDFIHEFFLFIL